MRLASRRLRGARSLAKVVLAAALLLGAASLSSSAAESPTYPGLPSFEEHGEVIDSSNWLGPRATGINEIAAAKQWARTPPLNTIVWNFSVPDFSDSSCRRYSPYVKRKDFRARIFWTSAADAPEPFGYLGPFIVRTVAFGAIPVEAEVLIGQPRDKENLPVGMDIGQRVATFCAGLGPHAGPLDEETIWASVDVSTPVDISIVGLKADGVDLKLTAGCLAAEQSTLRLRGREYASLDPAISPEQHATLLDPMVTEFFNISTGGLLEGNANIGEFAGCRTESGEDVSRLLTATVSGPNNKVQIRSEGLVIFGKSCIPDRSQCPTPLPGMPYPPRGAE